MDALMDNLASVYTLGFARFSSAHVSSGGHLRITLNHIFSAWPFRTLRKFPPSAVATLHALISNIPIEFNERNEDYYYIIQSVEFTNLIHANELPLFAHCIASGQRGESILSENPEFH